MQQLKIPQSPLASNNGFITQEWLVFINELIRLNNAVISKDVVDSTDTNKDMLESNAVLALQIPQSTQHNNDNITAQVIINKQHDDVPSTAIVIKNQEMQTPNNTADNQRMNNKINDIETMGLQV